MQKSPLKNVPKSFKRFPRLPTIKKQVLSFTEKHGRPPTPKDEMLDSPMGVSWHRINFHLQEKKNLSLEKLHHMLIDEKAHAQIDPNEIYAADYFNLCAQIILNSAKATQKPNIDKVIALIEQQADFDSVIETTSLFDRGIVADAQIMPSPPTSTRSFLEATGLVNQDGELNLKRASTKISSIPDVLI